MNYLAHFYLSFHLEPLIVGNFIADDVKGNAWKSWPEDIQKGILLHRAIDTFTDSHPLTHKLNQDIRPFAKKYAGPIGDILRDHFLSNCWDLYSPTPLQVFANGIYATLESNKPKFSAALQERLPRMIAANWLANYGHIDGISFVLGRFQKHLLQDVDENGILSEIQDKKAVFEQDFKEYFPELISHCKAFVEKNQSPSKL